MVLRSDKFLVYSSNPFKIFYTNFEKDLKLFLFKIIILAYINNKSKMSDNSSPLSKLLPSISQPALNSFVRVPRLRKRPHISTTANSTTKFISSIATPAEKLFQGTPTLKKSESQPIPMTVPQEIKPSFIDELIKRYSADENSEFVDLTNKIQRIKPINLFWEKKQTEGFIPDARVGATLTMVNNNLYLFGGQCGERLNDIKMLNYRNWHWEGVNHINPDTIQEIPEPRVGHTAIGYKNSLVVYGGGGGFNSTLHIRGCFPLVHIFDTINSQWRSYKPLGRLPDARRNHGAALVGNTMIMYGGIDSNGKTLADLNGLNLEAMQWFSIKLDKTSEKPGQRHSFTLTSVYHSGMLRQYSSDIFNLPHIYDDIFTKKNCGVYLFGGMNKSGVVSNDVYLLQPFKSNREYINSLKWTKLEPSGTLPTPRYGHVAVLCGGCLYVMGGRNDSLFKDGCGGEVNEMSALNIASCRWETLKIYGHLPSPRWGASAAVVGSRILYFGGMALNKFSHNQLHTLETDPNYVNELIKAWESEEELRKIREITTNSKLANKVKFIPHTLLLENRRPSNPPARRAAMMILSASQAL
ncbi:unnamed protein product [Blepharisma stoltei]|uniref:Kelch repeat-containing protein n=1 Tax=Blepharisma stoltei TaxID=1481888 RepID=A0AAU9JD72_9CILI|nr:unnamed protein product [Blepharisma stoltei]